MKKLFLVLAIAASLQAFDAQAQVKSPAAALSAVQKAEATTQNAKQAAKAATWVKYADALMDAYEAPKGNFWLGMSRQEIDMLGGGEKPSAEQAVDVAGRQMTKLVYSNKNLYLNENGQLEVIEVSAPLVDDVLTKAFDAYKKAAELDTKGQKTKDISEGLAKVSTAFTDEAYNAYTLGDYSESSVLFENAAVSSAQAPYAQLDTNAVYNAGFTAITAGENERAKLFFEQCLGYGYYGAEGEVYSRLADIAQQAGDTAASKEYLEEGFTKFPRARPSSWASSTTISPAERTPTACSDFSTRPRRMSPTTPPSTMSRATSMSSSATARRLSLHTASAPRSTPTMPTAISARVSTTMSSLSTSRTRPPRNLTTPSMQLSWESSRPL